MALSSAVTFLTEGWPGMIFAPDECIDHQQLRKWGLTNFECTVHIPIFRFRKGHKLCIGGEYKVATITNLKEKKEKFL